MAIRLTRSLSASVLAAQDRAIADRRAGIVPTRVGSGQYQVRSSSNATTVHLVTIRHPRALDARCTCPARVLCRHAANALLLELEQLASRPAMTAERAAGIMAEVYAR